MHDARPDRARSQSVSRLHVAEIRVALARDPGLAADHVLVAATHTHGAGALVRCGCVVCYACHPTDHGGDDAFSAGFPGAGGEVIPASNFARSPESRPPRRPWS